MIKNRISDYKLKRLLKEKEPKKIIYMHIENKITLTSKQLDMLIKLGDSR